MSRITDPKSLQLLQIVLNSARHLESLVEDALDLSRLENGRFSLCKEDAEIRSTVLGVLEIMKFQAEQKGIGLELHVTENVPETVYTDSKRLKQVIFNLTSNAIKFTFEGLVRVVVTAEGQWLRIRVEDTGTGMQQSELETLFRFFGVLQGSRGINKGGMGFGLTISKKLVT